MKLRFLWVIVYKKDFELVLYIRFKDRRSDINDKRDIINTSIKLNFWLIT